MPEHELGPVRALGWLREDRKPLLNAKLLVLGHLALNVYDPDNGYGEEVLDFEPRTVWWGSANWTVRAGSHGSWLCMRRPNPRRRSYSVCR